MVNYVGQQLGNYRLTRILGQGGFADIYLGEHVHLRTQAAIKVLQMRLAENNAEAFLQEARMLAHLIHPHIIRVLDFGLWEMVPFLVMDYAPGGTLRQRYMRGMPLPASMLFPYITQIASALQYAHNRKLIHRDVKPENMLIGANNEILLSDFGLALTAQSVNSFSRKEMSGTVTYMAPEQVQGRARPASDQYALAVVVYEWLTGSRPFQGSMVEIATQQVLTAPTPLRERVTTISPEIDQVVLKALAKNPLQRFASVQEFAEALLQASRNENQQATGNIRAQIRPQGQTTIPSSTLRPEQTGAIRKIASKQELMTGIKTPQTQSQHSSNFPPISTGSNTGRWAAMPTGQPLSTQQAIEIRKSNSLHMSIIPPQSVQEATQLHTSAQGTSIQGGLYTSQNRSQTSSRQIGDPTTKKAAGVEGTVGNKIQTKRPGFMGGTWVVVSLIFIFLLLIGGVGGVLYLAHDKTQANPVPTQITQPAPATPTAGPNSITPSPTSIYPPTSSPTLADPLAMNQLNWDQGAQCNFINGAYQIVVPSNNTASCYAHGTDYQNFVYQVQMTFVKMGHQYSAGGIAFRGDANSAATYYLEVYESGKYSFVAKSASGAEKVLAGYPSNTQSLAAFHTEPGQNNTLAIVANRDEFTFYVNNQIVFGPIKDDTMEHGMIGIFASGGQGQDGAEIIFSNLQLWQL